ncbi:helix-turn-helix domain-containing protein [Candidatus Entotheonella palauensis]|uniref:HTH cro/C1-type domain-containing protein n=1 Tax=Candidatus Entotheonella gemina TaxID=1429439 RepID=W4MGE8_9BACT|nr:helix-turn-helix domain-containing protein [Candidatus Entotheonella palauensis]ETX09255.1 MAG: hypothetical protein ETSY2_00595 [Candidatus Entotheonella gemina]
MSDVNITKFELAPDHLPTLSEAEAARPDAMDEETFHAAALSDADNLPLTEVELSQMKSVPDIKTIRAQLKLSQKEFARTFDLSLGVVRDWEQGRFVPDRAARVLLKVIAHNPEAVKAALMHDS